jgi:hypothetical protein
VPDSRHDVTPPGHGQRNPGCFKPQTLSPRGRSACFLSPRNPSQINAVNLNLMERRSLFVGLAALTLLLALISIYHNTSYHDHSVLLDRSVLSLICNVLYPFLNHMRQICE